MEGADHNAGTRPLPPLAEGQPPEGRWAQSALSRAVRTGDGHSLAPADLDVNRAEAEIASAHDCVFEPGHNHPRSGRLVDGETKLPALPRLLHRLETFERLLGHPGAGCQLLGPVDTK